MAKQQRITTKYAGVFYVEGPRIGGNGTETEQIFYIRYKKNGKLIEEKAGRQYKDNMSAAKANALRSLRLTGREPSNTERRLADEKAKRQAEGRMTIGRLWEHYVASHKAGKNKENDRSRFKVHVAPYFADRLPIEVVTADVERWKAILLAKLSPATVQRVMVVLRAIINFGVLRGFCPVIDPSKLQFKAMKVDNQKTEVLTDDELSRLLDAIDAEEDQNAAALIRLALVTGMRKGALLSLQWSDCDFRRGMITLRGEAAKNGKTDYIPMSASARAVLESIERADNSPYVFPGRNGGQRTDYRRIARRVKAMAGLPADFRPLHGLRHNYASRLASSGQVDMYTLQKLLTHENPLMTQRYAHLADETLKRAAVVGDAVLTPSTKNSKK